MERGGKVITKVIDNTKKKTLQKEVREHVVVGSALFTDALKSYEGMNEFQHEVIDHAIAYVEGEVHTKGLENFWSLLKRGLNGTYVSVEPYLLFRYLDEHGYRFNNRHVTDGERFDMAVRQIVGKRLTYEQLTGKAPDGTE
jgi:transposase-like protein